MTTRSGTGSGTAPRATARNIWIGVSPLVFVFLWSTGFVGARAALPFAEPFTLLAVRFAVVAVLMLLVALASRAPWPSEARLVWHVALAGILLHGGYLGGVFAALHHGLSTGMAAIIAGLQPPLAALVVGPLLGERVARRQWLGIGLGFLGVLLIVGRKLSLSADDNVGLILAFVAVACITAGTLYQKKYCGTMDLRTGSVIQFSAAGLVMVLLAGLFETMRIQWTPTLVFTLAWLVLVLSVGTITLFFVLIRRGAATKVASLFYLVAPVTAVMSYFMFDEILGPLELAGMTAVVLGVALVTREPRP